QNVMPDFASNIPNPSITNQNGCNNNILRMDNELHEIISFMNNNSQLNNSRNALTSDKLLSSLNLLNKNWPEIATNNTFESNNIFELNNLNKLNETNDLNNNTNAANNNLTINNDCNSLNVIKNLDLTGLL